MNSDAPAAGAFGSLVELRAVQARLGERRRREADDPAFWNAVDEFVQRGSATGVLLDNEDERWTIQSLLDYWAAALERSGRPRGDSSLAEFDAGQAPELADDVCPYLGLNSFQEANSQVFFGRDALVDKLVEQLAERRLIALVGPSGGGKSSLASAGLVGRLRKGALAGSETWRILPPMVPGAHPGAALTSRLADPPPDKADAPVVLIVDQFEELFTLCESADERAAFVADLLSLATRPSPPHRIVLTVRSDFESVVAREPKLYELYDAGRIAITPPSAAELRQAIEGPAALVGLKFEAGVIERLIQEVLGEPAGLPLLQFTLLRLWEERQRNRVTMASYLRVGGGRQALARAADAVYDAMSPDDQATARRVLLLVGLAVDDRNEPTRTRVRRSQLLAADEDPDRVERVLGRLIRARLLRQNVSDAGASPEIEVAHEALVRNWPRLAEWLQEGHASLAERRRLEAKALEWVRRGRMRHALFDEVELREAERWRESPAGRSLGASDDLLAIIAASRRQIEVTARRRRAAVLGLATAVVVLVGMLWLTVFHYRRAQEARRQEAASQDETRHLLAMTYMEQGRALLLDDRPARPMRALPYLLAARVAGVDSPVLRMLFGQASRSLPLVTFVGHAAAVNTAAYSRDGARLVTASDDHTVRIWDAATGEALWVLDHQSNVSTAAFSPDGKRVVTASLDHTARVWDAATGKPVTPPLAHQDSVVSAAFDRDGTRVVTASLDKTARVWDAATGQPVTPPLLHDDIVQAASFSPDGTRVITASLDKTARVWDAVTGKPVGEPMVHQDIVWAAAFSSDGTCVVTASDDKTARVWDAVTGKPVSPPLEHQSGVVTAGFNPTGSQVVTASEDATARVWDVGTGRPVTPPLVHQGSVRSARFSPDGTRVVTASSDSTARVWDASTGEAVRVLEHTGSLASAVFSNDGERVVTAGDDKLIRVWDVSNGKPTTLLDEILAPIRRLALDGDADAAFAPRPWTATPRLEHQDAVSAAAFSPDGMRVVTASWDKTARVWDAATGSPVTPPLPHQGSVLAAAFNRSGTRVITAGSDRTARIWDAWTGKLVVPPLEHQGNILAAAFSPDGTRVITASDDQTARLWDASTGALAAPPLAHQDAVSAAAFSPDGARAVTASADKTARIWDVATGKPTAPPLLHSGGVTAASFSPDATRVVTASSDRTARIWDATTGKALTLPLVHQEAVLAAAFSPDGNRVVTASYDKTARVWNAATGKPVTPPLEHNGPIAAASFSPDGALVVTASTDSTARVWDAATGKPVSPPLVQSSPIAAAAFSPDGTHVVTASYDKTARVWDLSIDKGSLDDWGQIARCSLFALVNGVLATNSAPLTVCPSGN
jgi:WD40 repeat protein